MMSILNSLEFHNPSIYKMDDISEIIFYFTVYSFLGWLLENSYNLFTNRVFLKENFLSGPFKPMYGIAPVLLVYVISLEPDWLSVLFLCFFIPTIVEYISGFLLKKLFHRQWWDYSDVPLNFHGHVCLPFSLCWIFLSLMSLKWLHPVIVTVFGRIDIYWDKVYVAIILYFFIDFVFALRRNTLGRLSGEKSPNPAH
jgi:uncharacterized membrane protein